MHCGLTQTELTGAASIKACILIIPERKKRRGGRCGGIKLSLNKKMCFHLQGLFEIFTFGFVLSSYCMFDCQ